jgi:hypothetical protein
MKLSRFPLILLTLSPTLYAQNSRPHREWLLPNLAHRLSIEVSNANANAVDALATIPVGEARRVAPGFPGRLSS